MSLCLTAVKTFNSVSGWTHWRFFIERILSLLRISVNNSDPNIMVVTILVLIRIYYIIVVTVALE